MTTDQTGLEPPPALDLLGADDTDEVYQLAYQLAAWALRNGMDSELVADWVLEQPRELALPRGSRGRLNPTEHHVRSGASAAVDNYVPGHHREFDLELIDDLERRISGSGVTHERYLLGVVELCRRYETVTPVVTGPNLAEVVGVSDRTAGEVLRKWSSTLAYGFFTGVRFDGIRGHGRVWTVDPSWSPVSKPTHDKGCPRGKRCTCRRVTHLSFTAVNIDESKCDAFDEWLESLESGTGVTVTDACRATGLTRYTAKKRLQGAEGSLLLTGTYAGGRVRKRRSDGTWSWVRQGETWFVS